MGAYAQAGVDIGCGQERLPCSGPFFPPFARRPVAVLGRAVSCGFARFSSYPARRSGLGALAGARVRRTDAERVFGFEIIAVPFVVAHLQAGLALQDLDALLVDDAAERAGVFPGNGSPTASASAPAMRSVPRKADNSRMERGEMR